MVAARPEYYGVLLTVLAGQGSLLGTTVTAGALNVTAYAIRPEAGGLNVVVVNKDSTQNLQLSLTTGLAVNTAELLLLTGPALDATSGTQIQGATVTADGAFAPAAPYTPGIAGAVVSCYVPAASAALIRIN